VVDPAQGVALVRGVDHPLIVDLKVKSVIGLAGIMRMTVLRLLPVNHFTHVLNNGFAFRNILRGENAFAMNAGAPGLDTAAR
jgi:hypothetical protein